MRNSEPDETAWRLGDCSSDATRTSEIKTLYRPIENIDWADWRS